MSGFDGDAGGAIAGGLATDSATSVGEANSETETGYQMKLKLFYCCYCCCCYCCCCFRIARAVAVAVAEAAVLPCFAWLSSASAAGACRGGVSTTAEPDSGFNRSHRVRRSNVAHGLKLKTWSECYTFEREQGVLVPSGARASASAADTAA